MAIARWKRVWKSATFLLDDDLLDRKLDMECRPDAEQVLEEFGPDLISLGKKVWSIQDTALRRTPWIKNATSWQ